MKDEFLQYASKWYNNPSDCPRPISLGDDEQFRQFVFDGESYELLASTYGAFLRFSVLELNVATLIRDNANGKIKIIFYYVVNGVERIKTIEVYMNKLQTFILRKEEW